MTMEPRPSLVTLGVADVARSKAFYEAVGFAPCGFESPNVAFYDAGGVVLGLFGRKPLAEDAGVPDDGKGFRGVSLAHNTRCEAEVDAVLAHAVASGASLVKPGQRVFWGGYSGYFSDPDGHLWEVAYNPGFPLDAAGHLQLPPRARSGEVEAGSPQGRARTRLT